MTPNQHGPYVLGCTRGTMEAGLSSDRGLKLDLVKLESLVIAYQLCRDEYVPGPCTHLKMRPADI